jgi:hypothetical protein
MKFSIVLVLGVVAFGSLGTAADKETKATAETNRIPLQVTSFSAKKERQVRRMAGQLEVPSEVSDFFAAAKKGDRSGVDDLFGMIKERYMADMDSEKEKIFAATIWNCALEVVLAYEQFDHGEPKFALAFGRDIIESIPKGSIYFGGTDPGRGLVTALSVAHDEGNPFFTLSQNPMANGKYLLYLRSMYDGRIQTPTSEDSQRAFQEYISDAQKRLEHDQNFPNQPRQIKPGEDVRPSNKGVQVSGQMAVTAIYGRIAKMVFDQNPTREFYMEESFPLDWMYPHLSPNGLIMKINRQPLDTLPVETMEQDRKYWLNQEKPLIGSWLKPETSVKEICEFAEKVFLKKDFKGFTGDPKFVQTDNACKMYSKARSSIGGLYGWRVAHAKGSEEKKRARQEADFAFRQAFAFCPYSPEAVFRYVNALMGEKRYDDALLLVETAAKLDPGTGNFVNLAGEIRRMKESKNPERRL